MNWLTSATVKTAADKQAEAAQQAQDAINSEALAYLKETDWYVLRYQETGKAIPQDVLDERQAARDRIL